MQLGLLLQLKTYIHFIMMFEPRLMGISFYV